MKKLVSILLALVMLMALCVPAFADEAPRVAWPNENGIISINEQGNYIITEDCSIERLEVNLADLTIPQGVTVTVEDIFRNNGTIHMDGKLILDGTRVSNDGTINVNGELTVSDDSNFVNYETINVVCGGTLTGSSMKGKHIIYKHPWNNSGVCTVCNFACPHEEWVDGVCQVCQYVCTHKELNCSLCGEKVIKEGSGNTASTLSEGNLAIVCTVAALFVGALGGFVLGRKKLKTEE